MVFYKYPIFAWQFNMRYTESSSEKKSWLPRRITRICNYWQSYEYQISDARNQTQFLAVEYVFASMNSSDETLMKEMQLELSEILRVYFS